MCYKDLDYIRKLKSAKELLEERKNKRFNNTLITIINMTVDECYNYLFEKEI